MTSRTFAVRVSGRVYGALLRLYPPAFRSRFAEQMEADFIDLLVELRESHGRRGWLVAWGRMLRDLVRSVPSTRRGVRSTRAAARRGAVRAKRHGGQGMGDMAMEVRHAWRSLWRRPAYALVAVAMLALAIAANALLFSILDGVLIRPLPYPDADRLVVVKETRDGSAGEMGQVSYPNFEDLRSRTRALDGLGALTLTSGNITGSDEPMRVLIGLASPDFMRLTGLETELGRVFTEEESRPGAVPVAVLTHGLWQQAFGADPDVVGRTIRMNGEAVEVVGVLRAGAEFGEVEARLWLPLAPSIGNWVERREVHTLTLVGRLAPDVTVEAAGRDLDGIMAQLSAAHPEANAGRGASVVSLSDELVGDVRSRVWILMGTVVVVLLIACANVANLLLARLNVRRRELALRRALGAGRWGVTRLFLTESLLLTLTGGMLGVLLARLAFGAVRLQLAGRIPRAAGVALNGSVLAYSAALALLTGMAFGLLPWFVGERGSPASSLGSVRGATSGRRGAAVRSALSVFQVAGSVVLLVAAGLLIRSLAALESRDVGFRPGNLATVDVSLSGSGRSTDEVIQFYRELPSRLEALPGVVAASAVNSLPISGGDSNGTLTIEGHPFPPGQEPGATFRRVLPGYFATAGIPVRWGREFRDTDRGEPMIVIISETMARRYWDDPEDAIGARIKVGSPDFEPWLTVVGVAGDVRNVGLATEPALDTYEPHAQRPWSTMSVLVRTDGDPAAVLPSIRRAIRDAGGDVPVFGAGTVIDRIAESMKPRRLALSLMTAFAALALIISSAGVYALLSWLVTQRTGEFGVRMALGARREQVIGLVARQGMRIVGAGLALGLAGAAALGNTMRSMLEEVGPRDTLTYATVVLVLGTAALLACYLPARRATSIDPLSALREDAEG